MLGNRHRQAWRSTPTCQERGACMPDRRHLHAWRRTPTWSRKHIAPPETDNHMHREGSHYPGGGNRHGKRPIEGPLDAGLVAISTSRSLRFGSCRWLRSVGATRLRASSVRDRERLGCPDWSSWGAARGRLAGKPRDRSGGAGNSRRSSR